MLRLLFLAALAFGALGAWARTAPVPPPLPPSMTHSEPPRDEGRRAAVPPPPSPPASQTPAGWRNPLSYTVGEVLQIGLRTAGQLLQAGGAVLAQATRVPADSSATPPGPIPRE